MTGLRNSMQECKDMEACSCMGIQDYVLHKKNSFHKREEVIGSFQQYML